ncbi:MAG: helix-turn-helix transcriptional regulator [Oscillospiraceae bacterium]|nr:helix-turn-helix transcriptional regulator [Oscillospiraceae bacterium]
MYKNKASTGENNLSGQKIRALRKAMPGNISQNDFAVMLQVRGLDLDKNAIQRIECGKRFITDIELKVIAEVLRVTADELLN